MTENQKKYFISDRQKSFLPIFIGFFKQKYLAK